jgi:hypothetical protein
MKISSKLYFILLIFTFLFWNRSFSQGNAGGTELKSIEEVIEGIDSLLGDIKNSSSESNSAPLVPTFQQNQGYPQSSRFDNADEQLGSFRVQNELMPNNLLNSNFDSSEPSILEQPLNLDDINPPLSQSPPAPVQQPVQSFSTPPKKIVKPLTNIDYRSASLEELLKEVDLLDLPMMEATLTSPMPSLPGSFEETLSNRPDEKLSQDTVIETPRFSDISEPVQPVEIEDYTVLGERIDHEMKERIREAIMETRRASGGSDNPYVTRSVFKATSYCNRVLGRLNAPHHKRYRRDVLLSLIGMHERNQAWVDAAKSYER